MLERKEIMVVSRRKIWPGPQGITPKDYTWQVELSTDVTSIVNTLEIHNVNVLNKPKLIVIKTKPKQTMNIEQ
jgi:hypothetical protein